MENELSNFQMWMGYVALLISVIAVIFACVRLPRTRK
jgi:hypothetical protein